MAKQRFQFEDIVALEVSDQALDTRAGDFAAAAEFAQTDVVVVGLDLDDGAHESPPMRTIAV